MWTEAQSICLQVATLAFAGVACAETPVHAKEAEMRATTNQLANEISPYLIQHAHNPVDWYPWGEAAFSKARAENKPIFLSIGYAACHWCHVMAHESFENEAVAAFLNEHFVSVKVDREERPDLDEIYMTAVQMMTRSGGWPLTVFLTPDLKPFYGGTYFPPADMHGRPGFMTALHSVQEAWHSRREKVVAGADELSAAVRAHVALSASPAGAVTDGALNRAAESLKASFDPFEGGFGPAPKFPPSHALSFLLRRHARTGEARLLEMVTFTLDKMARGGLYDQLGGGFHRYSVDHRWLVPHFEKMLYDNALLALVYLEAYQVTGNPEYARVARETLDYVLRDLADPAGGFHSSEDADSEGEEGRFYLWGYDGLMGLLGEEDGLVFCAYYAVEPGGNFASPEAGHARENILHIERDPAETAREVAMTPEALEKTVARLRGVVRAAREKRARPGLDDKVLASWNGLMIAALAKGYQVLEEARYRDAAVGAAEFVLGTMTAEGELLHTYRRGRAQGAGFLDDYAFLANGLVDLYEATFDPKWLRRAEDLAGRMIKRFWSEEGGAFHFTDGRDGSVLARSRPSFDGAEPSGNSMAALALLRLSAFLDQPDYRAKAQRILDGSAAMIEGHPEGFMRLLCAAAGVLSPPREIAIVGALSDERTQALLRVARMRFAPDTIVALMEPGAPDAAALALLEGKTPVEGAPGAYVCANYSCAAPVTTPKALAQALDARQ